MSSYPEIPEPSYREMREMLFKENRVTEAKQRRKAILALAIALLVVVAFREAWDHGIIAPVAESIWNMLRNFAAGWRAFLQEALRTFR